MSKNLPRWFPEEFRESVAKACTRLQEPKLVFDDNMRDVWTWFSKYCNSLDNRKPPDPLMFLMAMRWGAGSRPQKPQMMPPGERREYLEKVERHTKMLISLLRDTEFSIDEQQRKANGSSAFAPLESHMRNMPFEEVARLLLGNAGDSRSSVRAFALDGDSIAVARSTYPKSSLTELLHLVLDWCQEGEPPELFPTTSVVRGGIKATKSHYLAALQTMLNRLEIVGMPFPIYADIANVALGLDEDNQFNQLSVRKALEGVLKRDDRLRSETERVRLKCHQM